MIVDTAINPTVVISAITSFLFYYEQSGGLTPATVAACSATSIQGSKKAFGEFAFRIQEGMLHLLDNLSASQAIPLNCVTGPNQPACPDRTRLASIRYRPSFGINQANLPVVTLTIAKEEF